MASRSFVASRDELVDAGFSVSRIKNWLRTGRLIAVLRGVYSYGRDLDSIESAYRAALLAAGPGAVLTGRSACVQWRLVTPGEGVPGEVEVAVRSGKARTLRGRSPALRRTRISIVRRKLDGTEIRRRNGLELVSPVFALLDLAVTASDREVRFGFLEACRLGLIGAGDIEKCARLIEGRRGARKLVPLLALWVPELRRVRSVFEGRFLLGLVSRDAPRPNVNARVFGYEVDFYWPECRLVVETDGVSFHSDPVQRSLDAKKQRDLESQGLSVLRVTSTEFEVDEEGSLALVIDELTRREREVQVGCAIRS